MEQGRLSIKKVAILSGVLGLLIGLLLAALFSTPVKERIENTITEEVLVKDTVFIEREKLVYRDREVIKQPLDTIQQSYDSLSLSKDSTLLNDSVSIGDVYGAIDSTKTTIDSNNTNRTEIVDKQYISSDGATVRVAENELVFSKFIKPEGNPALFYCNVNNELDSILVENYSTKKDEGEILVEFWTSPINSIGYRLNKKRLVLFGFYEYNQVKLKFLANGGIEMKYLQNSYVLECGDNYRSLVIKKN